jgi:hypothetical protein
MQNGRTTPNQKKEVKVVWKTNKNNLSFEKLFHVILHVLM